MRKPERQPSLSHRFCFSSLFTLASKSSHLVGFMFISRYNLSSSRLSTYVAGVRKCSAFFQRAAFTHCVFCDMSLDSPHPQLGSRT